MCMKVLQHNQDYSTQVFLLLSLQNKLKKIKEKYKDQDEEDRELMMQLLGVRVNKNMLSDAMMP